MAPAIAAAIGGLLSILGGLGTKILGKTADMVFKIEAYFWALIVITTGLSSLAYEFLLWVLSPDFIKLSYTRPGIPTAADPTLNLLIKTGLDITQSLVNMALVVVLIYAALSIALRLTQEAEAKKMLFRFIAVALLVNFAPVLTGLVVDASNIVMNEFVKPIRNSPTAVMGMFEASARAVDRLGTVIGLEGLGNNPIEFVIAVWVIIFNFLLAVVFFMFGGILALRYLAIWILVILAPLGFVCAIAPQTKKYWELWRNEFLKWAFVGVPIAFFLYLGIYFTSITQTVFSSPGTDFGASMDTLLIYSIPLVFFYLALRMGMKSSAWGVAAVLGFGGALTRRGMTWGKEKGKAWTGWASERGGWASERAKTGIGRYLQEKIQTREGAAEVTKKWEEIPVARWFLPETMRKYGESRPAIEEAEKELDTHSSPHIVHRILTDDIYGHKAVGGLSKLVSRGDFQDLFKGAKDMYGVKSEEELYKIPKFKNKMERLLQIATQGGKIQPIVRGDPRLAGYAAGKAGPYKEMTKEQAIERATIESRRNHIANWEPEVLENKTVARALLTKGRESFEAIDTQVKRGQETALRSIDTLFSEFIEGTKKAHESADDMRERWKEFRGDFEKQHPGIKGYFTALEDKRFTARGWREGRYLTPKERETPTAPPAAPARPTPGAAVRINLMRGRPGVGGPAPSGKPPKAPRARGGPGT